jgi:DNA invertase Pin-like site-specific DNA recombinase
MTGRFGIYVRVSTTEQTSSAQLAALRTRAALEGPDGVVEYIDDGVSGRSGPRPAFDRLRADVAGDQVSAVLVTKLDRLGRSARDVLEFFDLCDRNRVRVVVTDQSIDTSTPVGRMTRTVLAALSELEGELIRERTREAMKQFKAGTRRTRSGLPPGRPRRVTPEIETRIRELRWPDTGTGLSWKEVAQYVHLPAGTCSKVPRTPRAPNPLSEKGGGGFREAVGDQPVLPGAPHTKQGDP